MAHSCSETVVHWLSVTVEHSCSSTVKHFCSLTLAHCWLFLCLHLRSVTVAHFCSHSGSRKHIAGLVGTLDFTREHSLLPAGEGRDKAVAVAERVNIRIGT